MLTTKKIVSLIEDKIGSLEKDEKLFLKNIEDDVWFSEDKIYLRAIFIKWLLLNSQRHDFYKNKGLNISKTTIVGELDLPYIKIDFPLIFSDCQFDNGINLMFASIESLFLIKCEVNKALNLIGATINGQLNCRGTIINGVNGYSVIAQNSIVNGNFYLDQSDKKPFVVKEEVNISGIQINGTLDCSGSSFEKGINAQNAQITQGVRMSNGFHSSGEIDFLNSNIKGSFDCGSGIFINPKGNAFTGIRMTVDGTVFFDSIKDIGQCIDIDGTVNLRDAKITKSFILKDINDNGKYKLDLTNAFIETLQDEEKSWPHKGSLTLDGFVFRNISNESPRKHIERLRWLNLQDQDNKFNPQPYKQIANLLDNLGLEKDAREIRVAMNNEILKKSQKWKQRFWLRFSGLLIGYGYKPFKVIKFALLIWFLGAILYSVGDKHKLMQPPSKFAYKNYSDTCKLDELEPFEYYPKFNPLIYSLDVFLPIVNLHQEENWRPIGNKNDNIFYRITNINGISLLNILMYFQILSGWILTTMLIGGFSGLVRDD